MLSIIIFLQLFFSVAHFHTMFSSKRGVVDPTHGKENAPYKVIEWLKLPPQLFCFFIAK